MRSDRNEIYYTACWRELQSFLAEVVRDDTGEYPQAADFLKLMKSIERKVKEAMLNDTAIMGRLTADPELRRTSTGTPVCSFTLAVERDGKPGKTASVPRTLSTVWHGEARQSSCASSSAKGRMVVATGRLQTRTWKDKHDQTRKETELNATNLYFGDTKKLEQVADIYQQGGNAYDEITEDDGELPF